MYTFSKKDYLRGTISIGHCRGHDCIILIFDFDGFYENHRRLLSKNYYFRWKNGLSLFKEWWIKNQDLWFHTSSDDFEQLRPHGAITLSIDRKYNIPIVDIRFDGWYENIVRLWPKHSEQREHVLLLDRTPLRTSSLRCLLMTVVSILFFSF